MARDRNILMMLCSPRAEEKAVGMISLEILAYMTSLDIMMELKKESIETNIENSMKVSDNARPIMDNPIRRLQTHSNIFIGNIKREFNISKSFMSPDRISGGQDGDDVCLSLQGETPGLCEEGDLSL